MAEIETVGRGKRTAVFGKNDLEEFFRKSGVLESPNLDHTPFLAFVDAGDKIVVNVVTNARRLATNFPSSTKVMVQWAGKHWSDYFQMTAGDVRLELERRGVLPVSNHPDMGTATYTEGICSRCRRRTAKELVGAPCGARMGSVEGTPSYCSGAIEPLLASSTSTPGADAWEDRLLDASVFLETSGQCTDCQRATGEVEIGSSCRITQPNGARCRGRIVRKP